MRVASGSPCDTSYLVRDNAAFQPAAAGHSPLQRSQYSLHTQEDPTESIVREDLARPPRLGVPIVRYADQERSD